MKAKKVKPAKCQLVVLIYDLKKPCIFVTLSASLASSSVTRNTLKLYPLYGSILSIIFTDAMFLFQPYMVHWTIIIYPEIHIQIHIIENHSLIIQLPFTFFLLFLLLFFILFCYLLFGHLIPSSHPSSSKCAYSVQQRDKFHLFVFLE
jgi:hypothetical protein